MSKTKAHGVRLTKELHDRIENQMEKRGLTHLSSAMKELMEERLDQLENASKSSPWDKVKCWFGLCKGCC